jgi:hypothetical protein
LDFILFLVFEKTMDKYEVIVEALNKTNMSVGADFNLKTEGQPSNNNTLIGEGGESEERVSLKLKSKFAKTLVR